ESRGSAMPVVRFADGAIQRLVMQVVQASAVMAAWPRSGIPAREQVLEKLADLPAVANAGEGRIVAKQTNASMEHNRHQKPRLAVGETLQPNAAHTFLPCHSSSSSAKRGSSGEPFPLCPGR